MAVFNPNDLTATTLEGAFVQIAQLLQGAEQTYDLAEGETRQNRVNLSVNTDQSTMSITATLPITAAVSGSGVTYSATEYAINAT